MEYEAEYDRHSHALYRVDKRSLLSICDRNRRSMITCYHKHYGGKHHEHGSASPKLENLLRHIDDIQAVVDGGLARLYRIDPIRGNLNSNQIKKYINPKLKNLISRCVKGE